MKLATVFSGIGAIEQALHRMGIDYEIVFVCDNGDVELNLLEGKELEEYTDNHRLDFCALVFVSILDNGCIYFLAGSRAGWAAEVLPVRDIHDHAMTEGVGAFFMQTVPALQEAFVRNG